MQVRRLDPDDVPRVLAVLDLSRLAPGGTTSPTGFYVVAWDDSSDDSSDDGPDDGPDGAPRPLGHAHLATTDPPEVQDVLVAPSARGRGVARALIEALAGEARALGADRLRLEVSAGDDRAREVYRRLGFVDAGLPPRRVQGTVLIRSGPIEVDDTLLTLERPV